MKYYDIEYVDESGEATSFGGNYEDMESFLSQSEVPANLSDFKDCWITVLDCDYEIEILEKEPWSDDYRCL